MVEMVNFMLHILYHSKKKLMTISPKKIIKSVKGIEEEWPERKNETQRSVEF